MSAHHGRIEHLNKPRCLAHPGEHLEERFEGAGLAQPPEALPHAVPITELARQSAPGDVVDREIMQGFEKFAVVAALVAMGAMLLARETGRAPLPD